jgi:integrase
VERWFDAEQRRHDWSARTRNRWAGALHQFGRWLVRDKKSASNPFDGLARQNIEADRRLIRRILDPDELLRLIAAARDSEGSFRGMTGPDRAVLYAVAAMTGRRLSALVAMRKTDVSFDAETGRPTSITTSARLQKSRRSHTVPVHPDLADDLGAWLASKPATGPLWSGWKNWNDRGADMIRHDLAAAREKWIGEARTTAERTAREQSDRLKFENAAGEVFDFHALRTQFVSGLALAGVPLTAAQQLADHSTPTLTANVYTRWQTRELAGHVAKLPGLRLKPAPTPRSQPRSRPRRARS